MNKPNNLFEQGREAWERTDEFRRKVEKMKQELRDKYQTRIDTERRWFKRQLIKARFWIELQKRTQEISSMKNLHLASAVPRV